MLLERRDFRDLTWAYLERAHADNVRHAEIFFDPQTHTARGVPFGAAVEGICEALDEARARLGLTSRLILCFLRHLDEAAAFETLEAAMPYREHIAGVGLDSAERGNPPRKFARVFRRAREAGFVPVAHAGEEGPAAYVREALDVLRVTRIDHGNNALDEPRLVAELVARQVPLTVCPLSNLRLRVVDDLASHPLRRMLEQDLLVTVNSDDPAYFGGYVNANYVAVAEALGLGEAELLRLARNSFEAAWLDAGDRGKLIDELAAAAGA